MPTKTPTQQAFIQFIESILITAIIAGLVSISGLITGTGPLNWTQVGIDFGLAVAFSLAHSLAAYLKALPAPSQQTGQAIDLNILGTVLDDLFSQFQNRLNVLTVPVAAPTPIQPQQSTIQGPLVSVHTTSTTAPQQAPQAQSAQPASLEATATDVPQITFDSGVLASITGTSDPAPMTSTTTPAALQKTSLVSDDTVPLAARPRV